MQKTALLSRPDGLTWAFLGLGVLLLPLGLYLALAWTALSLAVAAALGPWILGAALFGLALAWVYSAPPVRLKRNGWWGNAAVALCYEGLPWFTGAAVMADVI